MKKVTLLILVLILTSCSSISQNHDYSNVVFYKNLPNTISSVWTDGEDTFIVPKKMAMIQSLKSAEGNFLELKSEGAYFKVSGVHEQIFIIANDQSTVISK